MILIIFSENDIAGKNIISNLIKKINFNELENYNSEYKIRKTRFRNKELALVSINDSIIDFEVPKGMDNIEFIICASRHSSQSGLPVLTTHTPGNFDLAEFGGSNENLSISNPFSMKETLKKLFKLNAENNLEYQVSYEVTHHGPSINYPIQFIEVGGSIKQWEDEKATSIVSETILTTIKNYDYSKDIAIGLGGGHYAPSFSKIGLFSEFYLGHIIPKYKANNLKKDVFEKTAKSNMGNCKYLIIDWKGVPGLARKRIIEWAKEINLEILKTSEIETAQN